MSKELATRNDVSVLSGPGLPTEHELAVFRTMAKGAIASSMYRGNEAGVMMIMLAARELGIPPMAALNGGLHIIQGKVEISARMMNALIRRAGHSMVVLESTDDSCTIEGVRADNGNKFVTSYTIEEAKKAGLIKPGGGWSKCPKDMCFARAMSRLARQLFSDVIGIGYVEGEIVESRDVQFVSEPVTPAIENKTEEKKPVEEKMVTQEAVDKLYELLHQDKEYKEQIEGFVVEKFGATSFLDVGYDDFVKIFKEARKHIKNKEIKVDEDREGANQPLQGAD